MFCYISARVEWFQADVQLAQRVTNFFAVGLRRAHLRE